MNQHPVVTRNANRDTQQNSQKISPLEKPITPFSATRRRFKWNSRPMALQKYPLPFMR